MMLIEHNRFNIKNISLNNEQIYELCQVNDQC